MIKNMMFILLTLASSTMASMGSYSINEKLNLDSSLSIENIKVRNSNSFSFSPNSSISSVENLYRELNLTNKMDFATFSNAISGMKKLKDV